MENRTALMKTANANTHLDPANLKSIDCIILQILSHGQVPAILDDDERLIISDKLYSISDTMGLGDDADMVWNLAYKVSRGPISKELSKSVADIIRTHHGEQHA